MWIAVYWAKNRETTDMIQKLLYEAGVLVKIQNMEGDSVEKCFEILVEKTDVEKAHGIIIENGY